MIFLLIIYFVVYLFLNFFKMVLFGFVSQTRISQADAHNQKFITY